MLDLYHSQCLWGGYCQKQKLASIPLYVDSIQQKYEEERMSTCCLQDSEPTVAEAHWNKDVSSVSTGLSLTSQEFCLPDHSKRQRCGQETRPLRRGHPLFLLLFICTHLFNTYWLWTCKQWFTSDGQGASQQESDNTHLIHQPPSLSDSESSYDFLVPTVGLIFLKPPVFPFGC